MLSFMLPAILAGLGVAVIAGPLGCFVVWRRLAYFGDTIAHAALLGISLALLIDIATVVGVTVIGVSIALLLAAFERQQRLGGDTLLGILAHSALALGMVVQSFIPRVRADLVSYLFGDILAVATLDLWVIYGTGAAILALLYFLWRSLIAVAVSPELAAVEGVRVGWLRLALTLLLALTIAVSIKIVGILLITAMLIIPPATARRFSWSPESMAVLATGFGMASVLLGLGGAVMWDTPSGPSIVVAALALFLLSQLFPYRDERRRHG